MKDDIDFRVIDTIKEAERGDLASVYARYSNLLNIHRDCYASDKDELEFLEKMNKILAEMLAFRYMESEGWYIDYDDDYEPWVKDEDDIYS